MRALVCFDCDSTLVACEGLDRIAAWRGMEDELAPLTAAGMDGTLDPGEAYRRRLERLRPGAEDIARLAKCYLENVVPDAPESIARLQAAGLTVRILSGSFFLAIHDLALRLGLSGDDVDAVHLDLDATGEYRGFRAEVPLWEHNGKQLRMRELSQQHARCYMVGDGVTDLATRAAGAYFLAYAGVVARDPVLAAADEVVTAPGLTEVVDRILRQEANR